MECSSYQLGLLGLLGAGATHSPIPTPPGPFLSAMTEVVQDGHVGNFTGKGWGLVVKTAVVSGLI